MKLKLMLVMVCLAALSAQAELTNRFKVRCPSCGIASIERALEIRTTGSYSTNGGNVQQRSATFKCREKKCRAKFTVPASAIFVPTPVEAVEVDNHAETVRERKPAPAAPPLPAPVTASQR